MTLLYTEIVPPPFCKRYCIFFAADRRITESGRKPRYYKKLIEIPYLNAALGFFGLADWPKGTPRTLLPELLRNFVRHQSSLDNLGAFAALLEVYLNREVPKSLHGIRSGIHLAGFAPDGLPEFWYVRNIDDTGAASLGQYQARKEVVRTDAPGVSTYFRNGDIAAHARAWEMIDEALGSLRGTPGFRPIRTHKDYQEWIRFKMNVLKSFHGKFQRKVLIGGPIDVLAGSVVKE
jgi:hypothetical protein